MSHLASVIPSAKYVDTVNFYDAINPDIITEMETGLRPLIKQCRPFAMKFRGVTLDDTAENVWNWVKENITYRADGERQRVKEPGRLIADGVGDCKSYSLLIFCIMANYCPVAFRYVSFRKSKTPTHVYVLAKRPDGSKIILDGVWNRFNSEKSFTHKIDHWMTVERLTGITGTFTDSELAAINRRLDFLINRRKDFREGTPNWEAITQRIRKLRAGRDSGDTSVLQLFKIEVMPVAGYDDYGIRDRARRQERRAARQASGKGGGLQKYAAAPGRKAVLTLIQLNARGLANKFNRANPVTLKTKWVKLGGNLSVLKAAIAKGIKKKPFLGESHKVKGIGFIGVASLFALAGPVLIAISKILPPDSEKIPRDPRLGPGPAEDTSGTSTEDILSAVTEAASSAGKTLFDADSPEVDITDKGKGADQGFSFSLSNPLLLIGLGLTAAFTLPKLLK